MFFGSNPTLRQKSMKEVWNHITLSGPPTPAAASSAFPGTIFQDFLSGPLNRDPSPRIVDSFGGRTTHLFDSPAPPLTTALSLSYGSKIRSCSLSPPVSDTATKKRGRQNGDSSSERHQRMMKNRESAARSRARKQAYTYELELAVAQLKQENARLKKQQMKLLAASQKQSQLQPSTEQTLNRTLSAPF